MSAPLTPAYLLRRRLVLRLLAGTPPGRVLDVGCGRGELLGRLVRRGWRGTGLEPSPAAAAVARGALAGLPGAEVVEHPDAVAGPFDLVLATEVLEHVADDAGALVGWAGWLGAGGRLVLTVPAHVALWSGSDEAVGHLRRYERADLLALVRGAGLAPEVVWSYGFPVASATLRLRRHLDPRRGRRADGSPAARTAGSAFASTLPGGRLAAGAAEAVGAVAHLLQLPFLTTDLGTGYLVACRRAAAPGRDP